MTHPYADQLVQAMLDMTELDFGSNPGILFIGELRERLTCVGFKSEQAELIVSNMDIQLSQDSITEEQISSLAVSCTTVFLKIHKALVAQGFKNPDEQIAAMASKFSVKLS